MFSDIGNCSNYITSINTASIQRNEVVVFGNEFYWLPGKIQDKAYDMSRKHY